MTTARVPLLDENDRFPDRFTPQQVIDAEAATAGSADAASGSAQNASDVLATMRAEYAGYRDDLDTKLDADVAGQANGVATLDQGGKIPAAQLPSAILTYKGVWDAATNTPTLSDVTGTQGTVFIVSTAATRNLGSGPIEFGIGDWLLHNGTIWEKADNTDAVTSVNGYKGVVVLSKTDVGLAHVDDTADADKPLSTAAVTEFAKTVVSGTVDASGNLILTTKDGGTIAAGYVKGAKGDPGPVSSLTVGTVTKIAAGGTPTVTITGDAPAQTIDFSLVTGDTGSKGDNGDTAASGTLNAGTNLNLSSVSVPFTWRVSLVGSPSNVLLPTPSASTSYTVTLVLQQDATGSRTIAWPATIKWAGGTKPVLSTAPNAIDLIRLFWDGREWIGHTVALGIG